MTLFLNIAAATLLTATAPLTGEVRARVENAPKPVAAFIERRAGCNHFLGEEPYDDSRAIELQKAIRELRCHRLFRDERRLRHIYRAQPAILGLLDETAGLPGW